MINELRELEKLQGELQQLIDRQDFSLLFKKISPLPFFNGYQRLQKEFIAGTSDHLFGQRLESFVHECVSQERTRLDALLNSEITAKEKEFEALKQAVGKLKQEQVDLQQEKVALKKELEKLAYQHLKEENLLKNLQQEKTQVQKETEKLASHKAYALQNLDKTAEDWLKEAKNCDDDLFAFYYLRRALELNFDDNEINKLYANVSFKIALTTKVSKKIIKNQVYIHKNSFFQECIEVLQKTIQYRVRYPNYLIIKVFFLVFQREYNEALEYVNKIKGNNNSIFFGVLAVCYAGLLDKELTLEYLEKLRFPEIDEWKGFQYFEWEVFQYFEEFDWLRDDTDFKKVVETLKRT